MSPTGERSRSRSRHLSARTASGLPKRRQPDFVFPAPDGRGRDQRSTARAVERTFKRAGLDGQGLWSHNLRHTYASLLIVGLRSDPVAVPRFVGHKNPSTTLTVYAHLFDKARHAAEAREALSAGFGHLLAASS